MIKTKKAFNSKVRLDCKPLNYRYNEQYFDYNEDTNGEQFHNIYHLHNNEENGE